MTFINLRPFLSVFFIAFTAIAPCFLSFNVATAAQIHCASILSTNEVHAPKSLTPLIKKIEALDVKLVLQEQIDPLGNIGEDYYEISVYDSQEDLVGEITMVPMGVPIMIEGIERSLFTSHVDVSLNRTKSMVGTGLGTYLYVVAARVMHRLDGVLFSSTAPSSEARAAWERMVQAGWAIEGRERDAELGEVMLPKNPLSSYRFNQELLNNGFFDSLDERFIDQDMIFTRP